MKEVDAKRRDFIKASVNTAAGLIAGKDVNLQKPASLTIAEGRA